MTTKELNVELYKKMAAEQTRYREYLLTLPPAEILKSAYEYSTREDILLTLEYDDLHPRMAQALLRLDKPLDDVFRYYEKHGTGRMGDIWRMVEGRAIDAMHEDVRRKTQQER